MMWALKQYSEVIILGYLRILEFPVGVSVGNSNKRISHILFYIIFSDIRTRFILFRYLQKYHYISLT